MEQRKNDWVATLFFNQDKTLQELVDLGFTVDNSDIKNRSYYESKPEIQQAFIKENGEFDKVKFNNFYNSAVSLYNNEDVSKMQADILNRVEYDPDDLMAPIGSKTWNKSTSIVHYANPNRQSRGIKNFNQLGDPTMSEREVGQMNKIFNPETGEFEDEIPNDLNLWDMITGKSLVLASWDDDGFHEVEGRMIPHKKGELKYNEDGDTYYEYLNGRSLAGKELLHASDIITTDGSNWNKYDFFDSDGLDKSAVGVITKTLMNIAPAFIPYVGGAYAITGAAIELGKLLPELYKSIDGIVTNDSSSNETANKIGAWFHRFDSSTSDKGKQKMLSFENVGNMVSSSSKQLIQQRLISKIPAMINSGKYSENAIKWGRALSLSYMAGTSSTDTFEAFKEAGTSDRVAGLGAIASMFAMKQLMDNDYFRDFWYRGTPLARTEFKKAIKNAANEVQKSIDVGTVLKDSKSQKKFIDKTVDAIVNTFNKVTSKAIVSSALNEGIEETAEEISFDTIKGIANALNGLGLLDKNSDYDFGFSFKSMLSRYATSFVGGSIGGATFHLHDSFQNILDSTVKDVAEKEGFQELIYLIRNNRTGELRQELSRWHQNGKLGSVNLSGVDGTFDKSDENWGFVYNQAKEGESQNDVIYRQISHIIDRVEGILNEENLKFTDDQLKDFKEFNELDNLSDDEATTLLKYNVLDSISDRLGKNDGLLSGIFQDWNTLSNSLVSTKIQLEELLKPNETSSKTPTDIDTHIKAVKKSSEYKYLNDKLKMLRDRRDALIKGQKNNYYTGQLNFVLQPELAKIFGAVIGKDQFSLNTTGKRYNDLSDKDKSAIDSLYDDYKSKEKTNAFKAYDVFYNLVMSNKDRISNTANVLEEYSSLFNGEYTIFMKEALAFEQKRIAINAVLKLEQEKENPDVDLIAKLNSDLIELTNAIENLKTDPKKQTLRELSEKGESILQRDSENRSIGIVGKNYLNWLEYLVSKKLFIEPEDTDFKLIVDAIANTIEERFNSISTRLRISVGEHIFNPVNQKIKSGIDLLKKGNIESALRNFNMAFDYLDMNREAFEIEDPVNIESLLKDFSLTINPIDNGLNVFDFLEKSIELKKQLKVSPIQDLMNDILTDIDPKLSGMMSYILSDIKMISELDNLDDYIPRIPNALETLKTIRQTLPIIYAMMQHSSIIPTEDNDKLISDMSEEVIRKEMSAIHAKIDRLIQIAESNNAKKLVEQDKIKLNMRTKFANILIGDPIVSKRLSNIFDFDGEKEAKNLDIDLSTVTLVNYPEVEAKIIKLENKFYNAVKKSGKTISEVVDDIIGIFDADSLSFRTPTKITSDPESVIEDYDKFVYLMSLIAMPSSEFYKKYKSAISGSDIVPIFAQEYAVKTIYSFSQDVELNNVILSKLSRIVEDTEKIKKIDNKDQQEYLKNKTYLQNVLPLISGGAGTGKTFGVDGTLYRMLKDDYDVITVAPKEKQRDNLNKNIGHSETDQTYTLDEFIRKIVGRDLDVQQDYNYSNSILTIKDTVNISGENIFGEKGNRVVFIDEYSLFDSAQLHLISKWAKKNNVILIFSGDYKQNKKVVLYNKPDKSGKLELNHISSGVEDCMSMYTPELTSSIRVGNAAKNDDYELLRSLLTKIYDYYYQNPEKNRGELSTELEKLLSRYKTEFKFFNDQDGNFDGGEKIVDNSEIKNHIDVIKSKTDDWCVIYDKKTADKYKDVDDKHKILRSEVQGQEFDYIIIDYDWGVTYETGNDGVEKRATKVKLDIVEDVYTMTQRSRKGSILNRSGIGQFTSILDQSSSTILEMDKKQRDKYRQDRLNSLSNARLENVETISWEDLELESDVDYVSDEIEEPTFVNTAESVQESDTLPPLPPLLEEDFTAIEQEYNESSRNQSLPIKKESKTGKLRLPEELLKESEKEEKQSDYDYKAYPEDVLDELEALTYDNNIVKEIFKFDAHNEEKNRLAYKWLSAYFKYGWYLKDDIGDTRRIPTFLKILKSINKDRDVVKLIYKKINDKTYVCGYLNSGKEYIIPLFETILNKQEGDVEENVEIIPYRDLKFNRTYEVYPIDEGGSINIANENSFSKIFVFHSDVKLDKYHDIAKKEGREQARRQAEQDGYLFEYDNEGKTFALISSDPFATAKDFENYLTSTEYLYYNNEGDLVEALRYCKQDPRFRLVGAKQYMASVKTVRSLLTKKSTKNGEVFKHPNLIHSTTLAGMIKELSDSDILNLFSSFKSKSSEFRIYIGDDIKKAIDDHDKNNKSENFLTIDQFLKIKDTAKSLYIVRIPKDKSKKTGWLNSAEIISKLTDDQLKKILNSDKFRRGIMINDIKEFDSRITEGSNFYDIKGDNTVIDYNTDVRSIVEPVFVLRKKQNEIAITEEVEDVNSDDVSPEQKSLDDIKSIIESEYGGVVLSVKEFTEQEFKEYLHVSGLSISENKLFLVSLQRGNTTESLYIYSKNNKIPNINVTKSLSEILMPDFDIDSEEDLLRQDFIYSIFDEEYEGDFICFENQSYEDLFNILEEIC